MQAITERHPRASKIVNYDFTQAANRNLADFASDYKSLKRQQESIKAQMDEIKAVMIELMAGQETVVAGEYKISNKQIDTPRLDQKALREVHPDICKLFTKISTSTRFEIR